MSSDDLSIDVVRPEETVTWQRKPISLPFGSFTISIVCVPSCIAMSEAIAYSKMAKAHRGISDPKIYCTTEAVTSAAQAIRRCRHTFHCLDGGK